MGLGTDSKLFGVGSDYAGTGGVGSVQGLGSPQRGGMAAGLKRITSILQRMDHWRLQTKGISHGSQQVSEVRTELRAVCSCGACRRECRKTPSKRWCTGQDLNLQPSDPKSVKMGFSRLLKLFKSCGKTVEYSLKTLIFARDEASERNREICKKCKESANESQQAFLPILGNSGLPALSSRVLGSDAARRSTSCF